MTARAPIRAITAREVFDSRGVPTIEIDVTVGAHVIPRFERLALT